MNDFLKKVMGLFIAGASFCATPTLVQATTLDIYIVAGQSNAQAWGTDGWWIGTNPADNQIFFAWNQGSAYGLHNGTNSMYTYTTASGTNAEGHDMNGNWVFLSPQKAGVGSGGRSVFGPELMLGRTLYNNYGKRNIAIIKVAYGESNLFNEWNPYSCNVGINCLFPLLQRQVAQARQVATDNGYQSRIVGFFWMQGESDAGNQQYAASYLNNLRSLKGAVRNMAGDSNLPFVLGKTQSLWGSWAPNIQLAQQQLANEDGRVRLVSCDDCPVDPTRGNHIASTGVSALGARMADAFHKIEINQY